MRAEQKQHLTSSSLPTLLQHPTATSETGTHTDAQNETEYINHVPASNIDWTLPATRRAEYAEIDRSRTGVRGLLRRVTPRSLRGRLWRVGFHNDDDEGKGSDTGTVRRFRMDVDGEDEEGDDGGKGKGKGKERWWRMGKMGKGKGKEGGH